MRSAALVLAGLGLALRQPARGGPVDHAHRDPPVLRRHGDGRGRRARVPPAAVARSRHRSTGAQGTAVSAPAQPDTCACNRTYAAPCRQRGRPPAGTSATVGGDAAAERSALMPARSHRLAHARSVSAKKLQDQSTLPPSPARPATCADMPRYRVTIEYDGTPFVGWQIQAAGASVQGRLAEAIHKLSGETVTVRGAGRTDAGVHALGQVAHFDLIRDWPTDTVRAALNFHLKPDPIAIVDCAQVADDFDARFSARGAPLPLPHPGAAGAAGARPRPGVVGAAADARRGDGAGRSRPGRPARLHDLPRRRLPGQVARQDARPCWR